MSDVHQRSDMEAQRNGLAADFATLDANLRSKSSTGKLIQAGERKRCSLAPARGQCDFWISRRRSRPDADLDRRKRRTGCYDIFRRMPTWLDALKPIVPPWFDLTGVAQWLPPPGRKSGLKLKDGSFRMQLAEGGAVEDANRWRHRGDKAGVVIVVFQGAPDRGSQSAPMVCQPGWTSTLIPLETLVEQLF